MEKLIFPVSVTQKEQLSGVFIFEFNFDANLAPPIGPLFEAPEPPPREGRVKKEKFSLGSLQKNIFKVRKINNRKQLLFYSVYLTF